MAETFTRAGQALTSTSNTTVYTAPATAGTKTVLLSCTIANVTASTATFTVGIYSSAGTLASRIIAGSTLPANTSIDIVQNKIILNASETLRVQAGTSNALDVTIAALDITP